jgi:hypothetical protein
MFASIILLLIDSIKKKIAATFRFVPQKDIPGHEVICLLARLSFKLIYGLCHFIW